VVNECDQKTSILKRRQIKIKKNKRGGGVELKHSLKSAVFLCLFKDSIAAELNASDM
jgi:hypothetical protein